MLKKALLWFLLPAVMLFTAFAGDPIPEGYVKISSRKVDGASIMQYTDTVSGGKAIEDFTD